MALPLIAAGIAARAVASKLATRAIGGITGAGAKTVTPVYREMGTGSVKVLPNSSKGLVIKNGVITNNAKQELFKNINKFNSEKLKKIKSGEEAKFQSYAAEPNSARGAISTAKKIKINSNPTRAR